MDQDAIIIGAGMSGLAAGIRLAQFGKRVVILEKHYAYGGLNSYYRMGGRAFDVGLHAVTNYTPPGVRNAPLPKILRQLRIPREALDLREQIHSQVRFPGVALRFSNDVALLVEQVDAAFPDRADAFRRLTADLAAIPPGGSDGAPRSARGYLLEALDDPLLVEMLLCPIMFYGCPTEHDMALIPFATMFQAIFLQGFARPVEGVRRIIRALVRRYRSAGGRLRMRCGVARLHVEGDRVAGVTTDSGQTLRAPVVLSCAGLPETMRLCDPVPPDSERIERGRVSFIESIFVLDQPPARWGYDSTITFFNNTERFDYRVPEDDLIDPRSGVIACPNNYRGHEDLTEGMLRFTTLADPARWRALDGADYAEQKRICRERVLSAARMHLPGLTGEVLQTDTFTPLTIERFTGHGDGAVYGSPDKRWDGCTPLKNLFICGTDQGYLGIIGALMSGILMANRHGLVAPS